MKASLRNKLYFVLPVLSILTIILVWVLLASGQGSLIPSPQATGSKFIDMMRHPISDATLPMHIWVSLCRVLLAFAAAIALGVILGVLFGWNETFRSVVSPVFEILRPIPPIAWIPLVILLFGIGEFPKIFIVFIGSFVPIVLNTQSGMESIDPLLISAGKALGANRRQLLIDVAFPATIPAILAGIKTALSSGWMCVVAAEMIVAKQGVGFLIVRGQESGDTALIVVCMFAIGIVNAFLSFVLTKLEGVLCPWQFSKTK